MGELICPICDLTFTTRQHKQTCCSRACANTFRMNSKPKRYCDHCSKEITNRPRCWIRHDVAYCDKKCEGEHKKRRIMGECSICKSPIEFTEGRKRVVCSMDCMKKHLRLSYISRDFVSRRSFTEVFIVYMLKKNFPNLKIIENDRIILEGFEIDIYLPNENIGIECSGPHHYLPINGENELLKIQKRDKMKRGLANKKGISIITLKYTCTHSKTTKTKLIDLFLDLCDKLNMTPSDLDVSMKYIDEIYRT